MTKPRKPAGGRHDGGEPLDATFPSALQESGAADLHPATPQTDSSSHRLAYADVDFLMRDELRGVRLQLEFEKADLVQADHGIASTVVIFGSTRVPEQAQAEAQLRDAQAAADAAPQDEALVRAVRVAQRIVDKAHYYQQARELARLITEAGQANPDQSAMVVTGGGPGIMEAANRGAREVGGKSIGLNIVLPHEQRPNDYITPELCFQFHYFAVRKLHFLLRARALVVFPGGYGTLDEMFETLTLIQTGKARPLPVILFGESYWRRIINFEALVEEGTISPDDLELFQYVDTAEDAWRIVKAGLEAGN